MGYGCLEPNDGGLSRLGHPFVAEITRWPIVLDLSHGGPCAIVEAIVVSRAPVAISQPDVGRWPTIRGTRTTASSRRSRTAFASRPLSLRQASPLLNTPDSTTKKGLLDRAMRAMLLGCGLRRSEVAAPPLAHIQPHDNRWCILDLTGKHWRVRTIPMPIGINAAIDSWTSILEFSDGSILRSASRSSSGWRKERERGLAIAPAACDRSRRFQASARTTGSSRRSGAHCAVESEGPLPSIAVDFWSSCSLSARSASR